MTPQHVTHQERQPRLYFWLYKLLVCLNSHVQNRQDLIFCMSRVTKPHKDRSWKSMIFAHFSGQILADDDTNLTAQCVKMSSNEHLRFVHVSWSYPSFPPVVKFGETHSAEYSYVNFFQLVFVGYSDLQLIDAIIFISVIFHACNS